MFNIRDFIMDTLKGMCGNYPDFQIKEYALNWYSKGKLNEDDLAELEEYMNPNEETVKDSLDELETIETVEGVSEDVQVSTQENTVNENETNAV